MDGRRLSDSYKNLERTTSGRSTLVLVVLPTDSEQGAFMCVPGRERRPQTPLTVQLRARVFQDAVRYEKK